MKYAETWIRVVKEVTTKYQRTLVTCRQFENDIRMIVQHLNSPLKGLVYEVKCQEPFDELKIGYEANGDPTHHSTNTIKGDRQISFVLNLWLEPLHGSPIDIEGMVIELFNVFWKSSIRASPSGLISIKDFSEARDYAQNTLDEMISRQIISSVIYCDLDKFKIVNDTLGESSGDRVIQEFASLLERVAKDIAIPLNNGGDEFVLFCPEGAHEEALLLAYAVKNEVDQHNFNIGELPVDVSIGIATNDNLEAPKTFSELQTLSYTTLRKEVKKKTKGTARFPANPKDINLIYNTEESLKLAFCITKTNLLSVVVNHLTSRTARMWSTPD
jgi:diguanylate cyclase (GGDEF)-like protein